MSDVIGVRLKQLRIEAGLSMDDEAEKLNKAFNLKITKSNRDQIPVAFYLYPLF